jgi:hypothetical protein
MIRKILLPACLAALLTTACSSESRLPDPTGKGSVGAINAIPGSPTVTFRIEERSLGSLSYQASSAPEPYDDFDYVFNFDIGVPGESEPRRIASVPFKVEANRDHVFVLTGDLASPTVTTWTTDQRTWQESDTVFEARFAHLSESLGDIDVYLHDPDNPPAAGTQVATLSRGDVMDFADFAADTYRVTITAAGAVGTVHFQTDAVAFIAQNSHTLSLFDGNENDVGPYILTSMTATGQAAELIDPSFPPTINFVHAAQTLQAVDVYDDEALTNLLASDISLGQSSGDVDTAVGTPTFYFTPTGSVATTLFSSAELVPPGSRSYLYLAGLTDQWQGFRVTQDRSSSLVSVKLILFNGSVNHPLIDLYALERGVELDDDSRARAIFVGGGLSSPAASLAAGSYDVYVTTSGTRTILDGPFELDAAIGDVVSLLAVDDVDPEIVRLVDPFGP